MVRYLTKKAVHGVILGVWEKIEYKRTKQRSANGTKWNEYKLIKDKKKKNKKKK